MQAVADNILDIAIFDETLGQIAARDIRKAQVFTKYGLDFCCGGKKTLKQACAEKGIEITGVEQELQQADKFPSSRPLPYGDWSLDFLADYIVNTHHSYVKKNLPDIRAYAEKVMKVHGSHHPELSRIHQLVEEINTELIAHMEKEETVLFPFIKELVAAKNNTQPLHPAHFGTVQNPINMMEMEHEMVGKNLEAIRKLSNEYLLPDDACASYSLLYRMLVEFEEDLHLHIHLENNILFPKALEFEKAIRSMNGHTPIKRHQAIVSFSKDHHFGLLLVWKIRQGLKMAVEAERISNYVLYFFKNDLERHFLEEEEFLFSRLSADDELRMQAEEDHRSIFKIVTAINESRNNIILLNQMADELEKHIRFEERILFNHLQIQIEGNELEEIAKRFSNNDRPICEKWNDIFWTTKKTEAI